MKGQAKALSILLAEFWARQQADSAYPIVKPSSGTRIISGKVFDANNKAPLAYVNVGIPGKNRGTVTQQDGSFVLAIDKDMYEDSIRFSIAGYQARTVKIGQLLSVFLNEKITELKEVVVASRSPKTRRLGNTSTSRSVSIGFLMRFLGAELGVKDQAR